MAQMTFTRTAGGMKWVLPRRDLGKARWAGIGAIVMGLFVLGFMALWMGMPLSSGVEMLRKGEWFGLLLVGFALLGLPMLVIGLGLLAAGIGLISNRTHSEVEIRGERLISREYVMGLWWSRRRRIGEVEKLVIGPALSSKLEQWNSRSSPQMDDMMHSAFEKAGNAVVLTAGGAGMKNLTIAPGYPLAMLRELAEDLSQQLRINIPQRAKLMADGRMDRAGRGRVAVVEEDEEGVAASPAQRDAELAGKPPVGTKIELEKNNDGLTLRLPPVGIWKNKAGLFSFGLMWCAFMTVFTVLGGAAMLFGKGEVKSDLPGIWGPVAAVLFILLFWGIGIGMLLAGWHMGRRRAIIDVVGDALLVTRTGPLGTKQQEWTADQMRAIHRGPSGIESNDVPIMAMLIEPTDGKTGKLMTGWSDEELEWVAAVLRNALHVRADETTDIEVADTKGPIAQPQFSKITLDHSRGEMAMLVPARGVMASLSWLIMGLLFGGIGVGVWIGVMWSQFMTGRKNVEWGLVGFITLWAALFGGAGIAVLVSGWHMATRRYDIKAGPGGMTIVRRGLLSRTTWRRRADEIQKIEVADSASGSGNTRYYQLLITDRSGKKTKLATGRDTQELRWMVWELRQAMGLGKNKTAEQQDSGT